jgi:hypothetical protein
MRKDLRRTAAGCALLASFAVPAAASAYEPTADYNRTMSGISQCLPGKSGAALFGFDGTYLNGYSVSPPGPTCAAGELRVQRLEALRVGGRTTYMNRGGGSGGQRSGHISSTDLLQQPTIETWRQNGNGRPSAACTLSLFRAAPGYIHPHLYYKRPGEVDPGENISGAQWANYGDLGGYNYLLWNLPRSSTADTKLDGGGIPRAVLKTGQYIRQCDVDGAWQEMFNADGTHAGWSIWGYGRINNSDGTTVYGWWLYAHSAWGQPWTYHVTGA